MQGQLFSHVEALSDAELVEGLYRVVGSGRRLLAELLAHLCVVEDRRLHLDAGYPSLFSYCMARLGLSEDEAYRRINVARLARKAPVVFNWIAEGRLSLSVAALLQPYLLEPNLQQLIEAVAGKSVKAAREVLVTFFPRPDVVSNIRKLPQPKSVPASLVSACTQAWTLRTSEPQTRLAAPAEEAADVIANPSATNGALPRVESAPRPPLDHSAPSSRALLASAAQRSENRMEPLSPGRFKIQFTADAALKDKLELARDLLRHAVPSGDFAVIVDRALDLLVTEVNKRRFGATSDRKPSSRQRRRRTNASTSTVLSTRADAPREKSADDATSVTDVHRATTDRATRRAVCERDGFRCTWQGPDGVRCSSRAWLEQDHRIPLALGGTTSAENLRLLCRAHNQRAAELVFGRRHMENAIVENQTRHRSRGEPPAQT